MQRNNALNKPQNEIRLSIMELTEATEKFLGFLHTSSGDNDTNSVREKAEEVIDEVKDTVSNALSTAANWFR